MMEAKGLRFKDVPQVIKFMFGEENYQKWFDALPQKSKDIFGSKIKPSAWYSFRYAQRESDLIVLKLFYNNDASMMKEFGSGVSEAIFTGIYKMFIKFGSPGFIISQASSMASTMIRPSKLEIV
jgi:hypothetical protein